MILDNGGSEILRGLKIYVCPREFENTVGDEIRKIISARDTAKQLILDRGLSLLKRLKQGGPPSRSVLNQAEAAVESMTLRSLRSQAEALREIMLKADKASLGKSSTDVDGKYEVLVPAGAYTLVTAFVFNHAIGCWMIPVTVSGEKPIALDFSNSNLQMYEYRNNNDPWKLTDYPPGLPYSWMALKDQNDSVGHINPRHK